MEPLWKSLEAVEQDLLDMQAVHRYLRDRETRNRLCARPELPLRSTASVFLLRCLHLILSRLFQTQQTQLRPIWSMI